MRRRFAHACLLVTLPPALAVAQAVRWEQVAAKPAELVLIFERCQPEGRPTLPPLKDIQTELVSQTIYTEFIGDRPADYVRLAYRFSPATSLDAIPAFEVKTDRGSLTVPPVSFGVTAPVSKLLVNKSTVWAGEVFSLTYRLSLNRRNFSQLETYPAWAPAPLAVENWSKVEPSQAMENGEPRLVVVYRTEGYTTQPGPLTPAAVTQVVTIKSSAKDGVTEPHLERATYRSSQPTLTVRPLPPAPEGVTSVAVGQFRLNSKVVPETVAVGDAVTWTLELLGTGNWPEIDRLPQREASLDFKAVVANPKRTVRGKKFTDISFSEDIALVATKPGTYELAPVTFTFFDPKDGVYKTTKTSSTTVTVIAAPGSPPVVASAPSAGMQKLGGLADRKESVQLSSADPALVTPLQNLDQVRNQDSPSRLFQLMDGEKKSATPTKAKDR